MQIFQNTIWNYVLLKHSNIVQEVSQDYWWELRYQSTTTWVVLHLLAQYQIVVHPNRWYSFEVYKDNFNSNGNFCTKKGVIRNRTGVHYFQRSSNFLRLHPMRWWAFRSHVQCQLHVHLQKQGVIVYIFDLVKLKHVYATFIGHSMIRSKNECSLSVWEKFIELCYSVFYTFVHFFEIFIK